MTGRGPSRLAVIQQRQFVTIYTQNNETGLLILQFIDNIKMVTFNCQIRRCSEANAVKMRERCAGLVEGIQMQPVMSFCSITAYQ